ncbi:MAG: hypothetical protein M3237_20755 [Actinomycetota bacterium]|nr:hypothetical protein [Actinomycetota bacterium]
MGMPRRITRSFAAMAFGLAALTGINTPATAAVVEPAASAVEQEAVGADARTKEERVTTARTKEE